MEAFVSISQFSLSETIFALTYFVAAVNAAYWYGAKYCAQL